LDALFGAGRPARVVLVRLIHVAVALAVLDAGQDVSEQSRLAILELAGELVQDRPLHSAEANDRENRVDMGAQRHRVAERQQRRLRSGRRRSRPTTATRRPLRASATARFAIVVDLPSCSSADVTMIVRAALSGLRNSMLVRSLRNISA